MNVNAVGVVKLLDAIRACELAKSVKFYQASTSKMYGQASQVPQGEKTPFQPQSPYACSKLSSFWLTVNHRETYEMFACNGILFNHESPRRGENYVTRKITRAVVKIHLGLQEVLELGNLYTQRDWGHAKDYVRAMWLMLQQDTPDDYVIATGYTHSVKEFVQEAFCYLGKIIVWEGHGMKETGRDYQSERVIVRVNPRYFRPTDIESLQGNASKARKKLGWKPTISFEDLVGEMVEEDLKLMDRDPRA